MTTDNDDHEHEGSSAELLKKFRPELSLMRHANQMIGIDDEWTGVSRTYGDETADLDDNTEWVFFADSETAGKAARRYWEEMARRDPAELRAMLGDETLISWALGEWAGPGSTQCQSLSEWFDLWLDTPEEHFASYDSAERSVTFPEGWPKGVDSDDLESLDIIQDALWRIKLAEEADEEPEEADLHLVGFAAFCEEFGAIPTVAYRRN